MIYKNSKISWIFFPGYIVLSWLFSIYFISFSVFCFGHNLFGEILWISFVPVLYFEWLYIKKFCLSLKEVVFLNIFVVLFVLISLFLSRTFVDLSFDGQSYHQEAIIQLMNGWNPVRQRIIPDVWDHTFAIWLNHFPNFSWVVPSVFALAFGSIEYGKIINFLLVFVCFSFCYSAIKKTNKYNFVVSLVIAFILAVNPIFISQFWSFYLDNQLASLLFSYCALLYLFLDSKNCSITGLGLLFILSLVYNIKITAVAYVPIVSFGYILLLWVNRNREIIFKSLVLMLMGTFIGIVVLGWHPYITNLIGWRNPFYPMYEVYPILSSANRKEYEHIVPALPYVSNVREFIYDSNMPKNFIGKNRLEKLLMSLFSKSSNLVPYIENGVEVLNEKSMVKFPLYVSKDEIKAFGTTDVRISGFGFWFGAALLGTLIIFLLEIIFNTKNSLNILILWMALLLSSLVNSESWWARYVPQLYLLPILTVFLSKTKKIKAFCLIIFVILFVNCAVLLAFSVKKQYRDSAFNRQYLLSVKESNLKNGTFYMVDLGSLRAIRNRYKEAGLPYIETKVEIGVMENHITNSMSEKDKSFVFNLYKKNQDEYSYILNNNVSLDEYSRLNALVSKNDLVFKKESN